MGGERGREVSKQATVQHSTLIWQIGKYTKHLDLTVCVPFQPATATNNTASVSCQLVGMAQDELPQHTSKQGGGSPWNAPMVDFSQPTQTCHVHMHTHTYVHKYVHRLKDQYTWKESCNNNLVEAPCYGIGQAGQLLSSHVADVRPSR